MRLGVSLIPTLVIVQHVEGRPLSALTPAGWLPILESKNDLGRL